MLGFLLKCSECSKCSKNFITYYVCVCAGVRGHVRGCACASMSIIRLILCYIRYFYYNSRFFFVVARNLGCSKMQQFFKLLHSLRSFEYIVNTILAFKSKNHRQVFCLRGFCVGVDQRQEDIFLGGIHHFVVHDPPFSC